MNLIKRFLSKNEKMQQYLEDPLLVNKMSQRLISWLPETPMEYIILCIGTDRSTGDAFGPLTGSILMDIKPKNFHIYGTLLEPVHATNLESHVRNIYESYSQPYIIAIDASLGKLTSVGTIMIDKGALKPGAALDKNLPSIGDIHMTGIVNVSGYMEFTTLQNTRLAFVMELAQKTADILDKIDNDLASAHSLSTVPIQKKHHKQIKV